MTGGADDLLYCIRHVVDWCVNSNTDGPFLEKMMNAYELADRLENELNLSENLFVFDAANMLRQQADRIGVLEANHEIQKNINDKALEYIDQLEQGLRASIDLNNAQAGRHGIK